MQYLNAFRDSDAAAWLRTEITQLGAVLEKQGRQVRIMEVCGTHTMAIARCGIRGILPKNVRVVSGPGCPVCVTPAGYVDAAVDLAERGVIVASFGDMLRVPGTRGSLAEARSRGARVEVGYSPRVALELARKNEGEVVFLGIGFETTTPTVVNLVREAEQEGIQNLSILTAFRLVPPALAALGTDPELAIDAFLCPAHVSAIIGANAYLPFVGEDGLPCVVAGFEPLDILLGLKGILAQLVEGRAEVENQYSRVVRAEGNRRAQKLIQQFLIPADARWRGLGMVPLSGLVLRPEYQDYDAAKRHGVKIGAGAPPKGCRCGDVIKGKLAPEDCPLFGKSCTPAAPLGPCMVSSEGSCAASYKYGEVRNEK